MNCNTRSRVGPGDSGSRNPTCEYVGQRLSWQGYNYKVRAMHETANTYQPIYSLWVVGEILKRERFLERSHQNVPIWVIQNSFSRPIQKLMTWSQIIIFVR